jgi:hypothetical protein
MPEAGVQGNPPLRKNQFKVGHERHRQLASSVYCWHKISGIFSWKGRRPDIKDIPGNTDKHSAGGHEP